MNQNAKWWHKDGDIVVCTLCPRHCRIPDGQTGSCAVRRNEQGGLVSATFGLSTGFCIDPIEKKPLYHFLPGIPVLSFGTVGCNLKCKFCQNWTMTKADLIPSTSEKAPPRAIAQAALNSGCRTLAFTYNDPIVWAEYAIATAEEARSCGLKTIAVSSGYISEEAREDLFTNIDAANIDLKAFSDDFYRRLCSARLQPVLDTLCWIKNRGKTWLEITNLLIPGENDSPHEIKAMCLWIVNNLGHDVPLHFSAFHPDYLLKEIPATPNQTLFRAYEIAKESGLNFVYIGNIQTTDAQDTRCPSCGLTLIERHQYAVKKFLLKDSCCPHCQCKIAGIFEDHPGDWGNRRMPLVVADISDNQQNDVRTITSPTTPHENQLAKVQQVITEASIAVTKLADKAKATPFAGRTLETAQTKTSFNQEEIKSLLCFARPKLESIITKRPLQEGLDQQLFQSPAYGVFATLRRGTLLRACRGHWGDPKTAVLGSLLESALTGAALNDYRFPSITAEELPLINLELSLMHAPRVLHGTFNEILTQFTIGKHGLVIAHPQGQGLLLPQVATENGWDKETFLKHLSLKAGLAQNAWKEPDVELMSFECVLLESKATFQELEASRIAPQLGAQLIEIANKMLGGPAVEMQVSTALIAPHPELLGIIVENTERLSGAAIANSVSLLELLKRAIGSLKNATDGEAFSKSAIERLTLLTQAIKLQQKDFPSRHGSLYRSVIAAQLREQNILNSNTSLSLEQKLQHTLAPLGLETNNWQEHGAQLIAFNAVTYTRRMQKKAIQTLRQPAVAGNFYPAQETVIEEQLKNFFTFPKKVTKGACRGIVLPHAAWRYCGETIAKTINNVEIPRTIIIFGPKHTRIGANCSVSAHQHWQYPHRQVTINSDLALKLSQAIPTLEYECSAHSKEHCIEVLLPFFCHANPEVSFVPILIGQLSFGELTKLSQQFTQALTKLSEPILLVASSDLNHFAPADENEYLDRIAINALLSGDPRRLYDACVANNISMCGVLPTILMLQILLNQSSPIQARLIEYCNSSKASGDRSRVVGYAGIIIDR